MKGILLLVLLVFVAGCATQDSLDQVLVENILTHPYDVSLDVEIISHGPPAVISVKNKDVFPVMLDAIHFFPGNNHIDRADGQVQAPTHTLGVVVYFSQVS